MEFIASLSAKAYQHYILQDVVLICIVSFIFASLFYGMLRARSTSLHWNQLGKVQVDHLGVIDLIVSAFLVFLFANQLLLPFDAEKAGQVRSLSNSDLLLNFSIPIFISIFLCVIVSVREPISESFGLLKGNIAWIIVGAIVAYILMILLVIGLEHGLQLNQWLESRLGERQYQDVVNEVMNASDTRLLILIVGACIIAPVCEEIIFRGYLYSVTKRYTGPIFAAICTGILFGTIHGEVWAFISLSCLGIILAAVYEITGSLWSSIITHCLFNSVNVYFMTNPQAMEHVQNACLIPSF